MCTAVFERLYKRCPFCGHESTPDKRSSPEFVDGDLQELTPEALMMLRTGIERINIDKEIYREHLISKHVPQVGQLAHVKRHVANQNAQDTLRNSISWWAGHQRHLGRPDSESYRRFYFKFGMDVVTAQTLKEIDATALTERINDEIGRLAV